jgi:hypothetical protein
MGISGGPDMIQDGLVLSLDAADKNSYPGSGTTWIDLSGNNNSGTLTNGPIFSSANQGSIVFDGTNDYVQNPNRSIITEFQYSSSFTVESFVKIMESSGIGMIINNRASTDGSGVSYTGWSIFQNESTIQASVGGFPASVFDWRIVNISTTQFSNNIFSKWAHIVWTNSPVEGESKIYVNGINVTSQSFDNNTPPYVINYNGNHRVTLGMSPADGNPGGHYISGSISVARLYNKTLSAQEVLQNYNSQKSRFNL